MNKAYFLSLRFKLYPNRILVNSFPARFATCLLLNIAALPASFRLSPVVAGFYLTFYFCSYRSTLVPLAIFIILQQARLLGPSAERQIVLLFLHQPLAIPSSPPLANLNSTTFPTQPNFEPRPTHKIDFSSSLSMHDKYAANPPCIQT